MHPGVIEFPQQPFVRHRSTGLELLIAVAAAFAPSAALAAQPRGKVIPEPHTREIGYGVANSVRN
jgi:hypothetical protein